MLSPGIRLLLPQIVKLHALRDGLGLDLSAQKHVNTPSKTRRKPQLGVETYSFLDPAEVFLMKLQRFNQQPLLRLTPPDLCNHV